MGSPLLYRQELLDWTKLASIENYLRDARKFC